MSALVTRSVLRFADIGRKAVPAAGGKGASLVELLHAGIRVPDGFVVMTAAFRQVVEHLAVRGEPIAARVVGLDPDDRQAVAAESSEIGSAMGCAPLPSAIVEAIIAHYERLCAEAGQPDMPVAVRSSATSEDSAEASFAGLQDTYLWVKGAGSVVEHVRRCWASLYSVESVTYRLHRGIPETDLAMAVVVQQMVDARSSGVMFTRSPLTGDRSVIAIDASWGLGSAVVSGNVTPDSFVVNKVTGETFRRTVSPKIRWHQPDPAGEGVVETDVPVQLRHLPALGDEEIAELVAIGRKVEAHYGCPQDIEWAVSRAAPPGENVFLLQSRPETVWAEEDATRKAAAAAPAARAFDHVLNVLGKRTSEG
jgi:pyruvate,water dikinase